MTNEKLKGIIPRIVDGVFEYIDNSPDHIEFIIKVSMLEIYMENLTDLLNINGTKGVKIRETPTKGIFIENMVEPCVGDETEVMELLSVGNQNRKIGRTDMNAVSSRWTNQVAFDYHFEHPTTGHGGRVGQEGKTLFGRLGRK